MIYQHVSLDSGGDSFGRIHYDDTGAFYGRVGGRLTKNWSIADGRILTTWARANLWHSFGADSTTTFTNLQGNPPVALTTDLGGTRAQLGLGISGQVADNVNLFAAGDYNVGLGMATAAASADALACGLSGRCDARFREISWKRM